MLDFDKLTGDVIRIININKLYDNLTTLFDNCYKSDPNYNNLLSGLTNVNEYDNSKFIYCVYDLLSSKVNYMPFTKEDFLSIFKKLAILNFIAVVHQSGTFGNRISYVNIILTAYNMIK